MRDAIILGFCLAICLNLAGCGGGGGGSGAAASTPPPSTTPPPSETPPPETPPPDPGSSAGCDAAYDAESDFFPSVLWREKTVAAPPDADVWEIGLGSASGACRRTLVEFAPGYDPGYPSFWVSADGTRGLVVWVRSVESARSIEAVSFTISLSADSSYPRPEIGPIEVVASIDDFRFFGFIDPEISSDGACLAYLSDPLVLADPDGSDQELGIADVSSMSGATGCSRVGVFSLPDTGLDGASGDYYRDPKWSPDGSNIYLVHSVGDASGVSRVDLETGDLQQVIEPSAVERVETMDVSLYGGRTQIALERRNFVSGDGVSEDCTLVYVVDGEGNPPAEPFSPFLGLQPLWSTKGTLSQPGRPSVSYFSYSDGVGCALELLEQTDPFNFGPVITQYDPRVLFVDDVN